METNRLFLRNYKKEDIYDLHEYLSNPQVVAYEPYKPMTWEEAQDALKYRMTSDEFIAVELKEEKKLIGNVYLGHRDFDSMELGYVFHSDYWGKGYAYESCQTIISAAFRKGVHRIYAECDPQNPNSWRLLERLGFEREAYLKQNVYFWKDEKGQPIWKDTCIYGKLNEYPPA